MKTDKQGCSTCPIGEEQWEQFTSHLSKGKQIRYAYDYRHTDGRLFSCVAKTLEEARTRKNDWLKQNYYQDWLNASSNA